VLAIDMDPTGEWHNGLPTWPRKWGPKKSEMATKRQLRAMGLRPGGQPVVGQLVYRNKWTNNEEAFAWLYLVAKALPIRPMTPARTAALERAMAARMTCPKCGVRYDRCLPLRSIGSCWSCSDEAAELAELTADLADFVA
jgi:predicted RNA-binding Zn-ribbon protein involved in translation (DUF1610 family)